MPCCWPNQAFTWTNVHPITTNDVLWHSLAWEQSHTKCSWMRNMCSAITLWILLPHRLRASVLNLLYWIIKMNVSTRFHFYHFYILRYIFYILTYWDSTVSTHDDVIKGKHFPRYWPFVRWIHRWIPRTKASDEELWSFHWSASE